MRHTSIFFTALLGFCLLNWAFVTSTHAGTWDTLYTRYTGIDYAGALYFTPDDSAIIVSGLDNDKGYGIIRLYRPADGMFLGEHPYTVLNSFSRDGKYAIGWKSGNLSLMNWHTWEPVVTFDSSIGVSPSSNIFLSADGSTFIVATGYALSYSIVIWDVQSGKRRKAISLSSTQISYADMEKFYRFGRAAILEDGKTVVLQYDTQENAPGNPLHHHALSLDLESGTILNYNHDCSSVYAIPGSNDVILGHVRTGSGRTLLYCADGHTLLAKFDYPAYASEPSSVFFNQNPAYFLHDCWGTSPTLSIIETATGKRVQYVETDPRGYPGIGDISALSNNQQYVAIGAVNMYRYEKLFSITPIESDPANRASLFPQPTSGILRIKDSRLRGEETHICISDIQAKLLSPPVILGQSPGLMSLDVSALADGRYTLQVQQGGQLLQYPFILSK